MIKPGLSFNDFLKSSFQLPPKYLKNRYAFVVHGVGVTDEYPFIAYPEDGIQYGQTFEENMVLCVESYIGHENGKEGVKLEQQYVLRSDGLELLSHFPLEEIEGAETVNEE